MSMTTLEMPKSGPEEGFEPYREISKAAVASLVLSMLSLGGFFFPALLTFALMGLVLGVHGYRSIQRYPMELIGKTPAVLGAIVSAAILMTGTAKHFYDYATEVPEGYARLSFSNLQPVRENPELPVSPESLQLNGKKIFIKGYVYPDGQKNNIKRFILVPDMGTCCFGGQPKLTDMIEVTLQDPKRIEYAIRKRKIGGTLHVDTRLKPVSGVNGVFYQLDADYVQ